MVLGRPFGPAHYVPALKLKRGEKAALRMLNASTTTDTTPLFEVVELTDASKSLEAHIATSLAGLKDAVARFDRLFLDAGELEPLGASAADAVFQAADAEGLQYTPVTAPGRFDEGVVAGLGRGAGLRVSRNSFEAGSLPGSISSFLGAHKLSESDVDLFLDCGDAARLVALGVANLTRQMLRAVPNPGAWRTMTMLACGFPESMAIVPRSSTAAFPRHDWLGWSRYLYPARARLKRMPSFGDYAVQHIAGVEGFDPRIHQSSATIRYTLDASWLIIRGVGTRVTRPSQQFPGLATQLVADPRYMGISHCQGCGAMDRAAQGASGLGSLEVWRRLGTTHHVEVTAAQVKSLAWP